MPSQEELTKLCEELEDKLTNCERQFTLIAAQALASKGADEAGARAILEKIYERALQQVPA